MVRCRCQTARLQVMTFVDGDFQAPVEVTHLNAFVVIQRHFHSFSITIIACSDIRTVALDMA